MNKLISLLLSVIVLLSMGTVVAEDISAAPFAWHFIPLNIENEQVYAKGTLAWNETGNTWMAVFDSSYGVAELEGIYADGKMILEKENVRVTNGYGKYLIHDIQPLFDDVMNGWKGVFVSFESSGNKADGRLFWNPASQKWKASFSTPYGNTELAGTYDTEGILTLNTENTEVTKGYGKYFLPDLQPLFSEAIQGWVNVPLSFSSNDVKVNGSLFLNNIEMEWKAVFDSPYGVTKLDGSIGTDGNLALLHENEDVTKGYGKYFIQDIQAVFNQVLTGKIPLANNEEILDVLEQHARNIEAKYDPAMNQGQIVFYGASNFRMWENMAEDLSPYPVQNHGIGGSADPDLVAFADRLLYPYNPSIVFFQTASNDFVNLTDKGYTGEEAIAECMEYKAQMYQMFHEKLPNAKLVITSAIMMPGRTQFAEMNKDINQRLQALCDQYDYMYFINAEALTYDGANYRTDLFRDDMIHLNAEGEKLWADEYILPLLNQITK